MANRQTTAILLLVATYFLTCASGKGIISSRLQKRFLDGGDDSSENVIVSFDQDISQVFDQINSMNFTDDDEKRTAQTDAQEQFTESAQAGLKSFLDMQGVQSESFWIDNTMFVPDASPSTVEAIANFPGVEGVEEEEMYSLDHPTIEAEDTFDRISRQSGSATWGVRKIRADQVWNTYRGRGIVVANIDTGVRVTHEALPNWRSSYGWYDPYYGTERPDDRNGHGTHVMGTIAGGRGIGVAPDATWIACRGCDDRGCSGSALRSCGQWVQCPSRPNGQNRDCSQAPQVVCNSWGGGQGDTSYRRIVDSWHQAGIIPVFAIGNSGPNCDTANSPGDLNNVIGVGNTDQNDRIARSSSLGPTTDGRIKPDISAPGTQITSASHQSDTRYVTMTGTSMAAPHVTGVVALMKQHRSSANYDQIYRAITNSASTNLDTSTARNCGGRQSSRFPNNVFGHGLIDVPNCINAM